jgi:hypothetical protein
MTKASLIALTAVVWTGGFAATGTLVRVLQHPAAPQPLVTYVDAGPAWVALTPQTPRVEEERILVMPTVEIVTKIPRALPPPKPTASELRCGEWKPLIQGSGAVQICE